MAILLIIGIVAFAYGFLTLVGIVKTDTSKDSEEDKKLLSQKSRYSIGRYWAGSQGVLGGAALILLYIFLHFAQ
jgi:hypothetical protein